MIRGAHGLDSGANGAITAGAPSGEQEAIER